MKSTNNIRTRIAAGILAAITTISAMAVTSGAYLEAPAGTNPATVQAPPEAVKAEDPTISKDSLPYIDKSILEEIANTIAKHENGTETFDITTDDSGLYTDGIFISVPTETGFFDINQ